MKKTANSPCPVCSKTGSVFVLHSDADIYECNHCSHSFTDQSSIAAHETYSADYYQKAHKNWFENPNISLFAWICTTISGKAKSLLDVGCGNGAFLRYAEGHAEGINRLVGVDYSPNQSTDKIEFFIGDAATIPGNETFDAVVSLAVIEHVPDPIGFARLMADRCNAGGHVIVLTVNNDSILYRMARLMYRLGMKTPATRLYSSHHLQHFTIASLQSTLEKAGLKIVSTRTNNAPLAAIDIPEGGALKQAIFKVGLVGLCMVGSLTGRAYLQTVLARKL